MNRVWDLIFFLVVDIPHKNAEVNFHFAVLFSSSTNYNLPLGIPKFFVHLNLFLFVYILKTIKSSLVLSKCDIFSGMQITKWMYTNLRKPKTHLTLIWGGRGGVGLISPPSPPPLPIPCRFSIFP